MFNLCYWDMETTDLGADWGRVLVAGIKPAGKKPIMLVNESLTKHKKRSNDRDILVKIRDTLDNFDFLVSYYGGMQRFDLPMLNTRLLVYGERPLPPKFHVDLYYYVRKYLRFQPGHRRLDNVLTFFGYPDVKTKITQNAWIEAAMDGDKKAIDKIVFHCKRDVEALELLFPKLLPFIHNLRRKG